MPRANPLYPSFNAGELSPRLAARTDFAKYPAGLEICENLVPLAEGGLMRRAGSRFIAEVKDSDRTTILVPFQFSVTQAYILEFGHQYVRVYMNQGRIETGGTPVEVATPYDEAELRELQFAQSADVLYIVHPSHRPRTLKRTSHTSWSLDEIEFRDGPYLEENTTDTELSPSGRTGTITITANATEGINDGAGFSSNDIGRLVRLFDGYARITAVASSTQVTADVVKDLTPSYVTNTIRFSQIDNAPDLIIDTNGRFLLEGFQPGRKVTVAGSASNNGTYYVAAVSPDELVLQTWRNFLVDENPGPTVTIVGAVEPTKAWRLGIWSDTLGWPSAVTFFEERLFFAGGASTPQRIVGSVTADFTNFRPGSEPDDAVSFAFAADQVNVIRWLSPGEALVVGTVGGEWVVTGGGSDDVITPDNIQARRHTNFGGASIQPLRVNNVAVFVQRARRKLREFGFTFEIEGYQAFDLTRLARHITKSGLVELAYAQEPDSVIWAVRQDGQLLSMTYRREEDVVGWSRHILGGSFNGGHAVVESIGVIPGADAPGQVQSSANRDEIWLIVKRTINGQTKRYVEVLERDFESGDRQADAYYSDALITYDGAAATVIGGLDHLEGETVKVLADGAIAPDTTVSGGQIELHTPASVVQIGLGYRHRLKTLKMEAGAAAGTAVGKTKRIRGITFVLLDSLTLQFGPSSDDLHQVDFRVVADPMDAVAPLFTGEQFFEFDGDYETDTRIVVESDAPVPFTLLAMAPEMATNELV